MGDGGDGFVGRCEIVEPRRLGKRRWSERIVAESLQPGVRVADVAARYDIQPHHLSDWRRHARQGRIALPEHMLAALQASAPQVRAEPAFVPLAVLPEPEPQVEAVPSGDALGVLTVEIGPDMIVHIPESVTTDRAVALVRALRRLA